MHSAGNEITAMRDAAAEKTALSIFACPSGERLAGQNNATTENIVAAADVAGVRRTFSMSDVFPLFDEKTHFLWSWTKDESCFFSICFLAALIAPFFFCGSFRRWLPLQWHAHFGEQELGLWANFCTPLYVPHWHSFRCLIVRQSHWIWRQMACSKDCLPCFVSFHILGGKLNLWRAQYFFV